MRREINSRLDAVQELSDTKFPFIASLSAVMLEWIYEELAELRVLFKSLTDLERGLCSIYYKKVCLCCSTL
jgi:hypothetical protein